MTEGVGFALGALVCYGLSDLVYKRAAVTGVPPHQFMMVQTWFFLSLVTLYGVVTGTLAFGTASLWGAAAGVFAFTGFYNFAQSLKSGSVSVNAPIFRLSFTVTAILAVLLLHEPLTFPKLAGIGLALIAVWLLLGGTEFGAERKKAATASLVRVLIATASVGIANLLYKYGLRDGATPASLLCVQAIGVVTMSTALSGYIDGRVRPVPRVWPFSIVAALLLSSAFVLLLEGLARGQASILVPIAQMGFVVTAAVGFVFLREPLYPAAGASASSPPLAALASLGERLTRRARRNPDSSLVPRRRNHAV
ncbi:MAG: DMT family transporter [Gammaproteobacteria bacterium]|nr:DMT family transporter [Gammaproteobacteria bacterium]